MYKLISLTLGVSVLIIPVSVCIASAADYERKVPYSGNKVTSSTLLCKANNMAAGGFWGTKDGSVEERAHIAKEPQPTFWKITMKPDLGIAHVSRFNPNNEDFTSPELYALEFTPPGGFLLIRADRVMGTSPETITIDPSNSSFVVSSQHVNTMWNRANIWYGSCRSE